MAKAGWIGRNRDQDAQVDRHGGFFADAPET